MSQALTKPTTERAIVMAKALQEDTEQRAIVKEYVHHHMSGGIDYGVIPGTQKPTLLKPGAEKLTDLFRCTPSFEILKEVEDWDSGLFYYQFKVKIVSRTDGTVLAEGFGSANSREGRYRWRNAARKCPICGKETIIKGKTEYGGGWICFAKKGGCGAKWDDGAQEIEGQEQGRVENDDIYTMTNTILKMAKKRALVDGAITLARCSDIFTQDVEDMTDASFDEPRPKQRNTKQAPKNAQPMSLGSVLSFIDAAKTIEELVAIEPHAAKLSGKDKPTARAAYTRKREELMKAPDEPPPHDPQTGEVLQPGDEGYIDQIPVWDEHGSQV